MPIVAFDPDNNPVTALGVVHFNDPKAGHYRAAVLSADRPLELRPFAFPECGDYITLDVAPSLLTGVSAAAVRDLGMTTSEDGVEPAESLGRQAEFRLTSLLAFGAYAAYSARSDVMRRLRAIKLKAINRKSQEAWVTILVGVTGYEPLKGASVKAFLRNVQALLPGGSPGGGDQRLRPIVNLPGTAYLTARCPLGSYSVEVSLPGIPPTRFAMNGMAGRVSTLVIGVADDGNLEVLQYLFKLGGGDLEETDLPLIEKAQRFFVAGRPVPASIIDALLDAKMTDPLTACLAGYALVRDGRREQFRGDFRKGDTSWNEYSAMQNMLNHFGNLCDTHILAGLCAPEDRHSYFSKALECGLPVFADGFRVLIDYFGKALDRYPSEFDRARRTLSIGTAYSSWLSREPQLAVQNGRFEPPPVQWRQLEIERPRIERFLTGCGLVTVVGDKGTQGAGTGFLVAPDLVVTANHVVGQATETARVYFSRADECRVTGGAPGDGILCECLAIYPEARVALLRLMEPLNSTFVLPVSELDHGKPGRAICVLGYNVDLKSSVVRKFLLPGFILAAVDEGETFDHDASTVGGSGGAPVLDVETGTVIGMHWGGMAEGGYKRNRASRFLRPFIWETAGQAEAGG
ncbi:hypothetical protein J2Z31_002833 [Sinorhizobium kostiense]|uniref:Serine protease n=2 Tax=Sinorhizobium TaxID=28105 RepID=A0ABS4R096_9HYPH|nr:serine protease [Sinorhizobium kostiense]MBP2236319.1 hypothetical protein [Sinorhizobium kostiense]